jgi:hypothetical protein
MAAGVNAPRFAVIDQRVEVIGFVEHRIRAQLLAARAHVGRGVVGEHHIFCRAVRLLAGLQHAQAAALLEKQINDGQVPDASWPRQPALPSARSRHSQRPAPGQFLQRTDQVLADGRVVFDDIGSQFHHG